LLGNLQHFRKYPGYAIASAISGGIIVGILLLMGIFCYQISPYDPLQVATGPPMSAPTLTHLFGTDGLGRDVLSRVITGSRYSLSVAFIAVIGGTIIGVALGLVSGYEGGRFDRVASLFMDSWIAFPTIVIALLMVAFLSPSFSNIAFAIMISMVPRYFRMVRSLALTLKSRTFVEVARSIGLNDFYIMWRHILPHTIPTVIILMTLNVPTAILTVASLGFLGVGIPPPTPEWGTDLNIARDLLLSGVWAPSFFPGLFIFIACIGFNLLGDGVSRMIGATVERV
jgi:peptide/nickel transport system permease protein